MAAERLVAYVGPRESIFGDIVSVAERILLEHNARELQQWVRGLRAQGVRAAQPDEGWVDWKHRVVFLSPEPFFDDDLRVGDLLAIGEPAGPVRLVRIMRRRRFTEILWRCTRRPQWYFEEVSRG